MSLIVLAAGLVLAGGTAGVMAGLLGIGGGIVIVPTLFYLFTALDLDLAVRLPLAVGTSLSTIVVTSTVSARAHWKRGSVDLELLKSWAPWIVTGVVIGTLTASFAPQGAMMTVFATMAFLVALYMAFSPEELRLAQRLPLGPIRWIIATLIGGVSALMGIGGGTLTVPTLVLTNHPVRKAVGTAAAVGFIIAVPATIGFILAGLGDPHLPAASLGYVNLLGFIVIVPMTTLLAPVGARLAHRLDARILRLAFALFLMATSVRMFMELFGVG